jgi:hypothetical protein
MTSHEILDTGSALLAQRPHMATPTNVANLLLAAALTHHREEMGGLEHVQFAYRNDTPIVPPGHECHPVELVKRGYVDGVGWPKVPKPKVHLFRWPDGQHWYASVEGKDVVEDGRVKWNTQQEAEDAANRAIAKGEGTTSPCPNS